MPSSHDGARTIDGGTAHNIDKSYHRPPPPPKEPARWIDRLMSEVNPFQNWFLKTHPAHDKPVDISASFAPEGCKVLFLKLACGGFVIGTAIYSFLQDTDERGFWFAYMTNWVLVLSSIYFLLSIFNTLFGVSQPYKRVSSPIVKMTWLLYSVSAHMSWLVAMFFWMYIFEKGVTPLDYINMVPHVVVPITVTFDGLNVNRIPLRWQMYTGFVIPVELGYVLWTYFQSRDDGMSNPNLPDTATDDAIYPEFDWEDLSPLFLSLVGIFCIGPIVWLCMWLLAQYWFICCCLGDRRLYYTDPRKRRATGGPLEGAGLSSHHPRIPEDQLEEDSDESDDEFADDHSGKDEESSGREEETVALPKTTASATTVPTRKSKRRNRLDELANAA